MENLSSKVCPKCGKEVVIINDIESDQLVLWCCDGHLSLQDKSDGSVLLFEYVGVIETGEEYNK